MHIDYLVAGCQLSRVPNCLVQHTQSLLDIVVVVVVVVILLTVVVSPFESNLEWE